MTDGDLLELAAKAAGLAIDKSYGDKTGFDVCGNVVLDWHNGVTWNPLTDDGDAGCRRHQGFDNLCAGGEMTDRIPTAPVAAWLDPDEHPPPVAKKLLLLTRGGVAVLGHWGYGCVAWSPLPKVPPKIKSKLLMK